MPRFVQAHLTTPVEDVIDLDALCAAGVPATSPLPALVEPTDAPPVERDIGEPLVVLEHPRIVVVPAYRTAGWTHAVEDVLVRQGVGERLGSVADRLPPRWGLCLLDGWRPLALQTELYDAAYRDPELPPGFLAPPTTDPLRPPPHLTGGSVDVTLTLDGRPLGLGTAFDDFTPQAATPAFESTPGVVRDLRRWLYWSMRSGGFVALVYEWWHFEHGTRRWAAITGRPAVYAAATPT